MIVPGTALRTSALFATFGIYSRFALCSWTELHGVKKSRYHRAWLSEGMHSMNENLGEYHVPVGQLPAFEGASVYFARYFVI